MAPLAIGVTFGLLASVPLLALWLLRWPLPLRPTVVVLTAVATHALGRSVRYGLHPLALAVLGGGLAVQIIRWAERAVESFNRGMTRTVIAASGYVLAGAAVSFTLEWMPPASATAAAGRPNVVLVVLDTVRASNLSLYGHNRPTSPYLDELATTSIVFDRAISTTSWTLPSHGTLFTGQYPDQLTASWGVPLDGSHETIGEVLRSGGWRTGGFVANTFFAGSRSGLARGFSTYLDAPLSVRSVIANSWLARKLVAKYKGEAEVIEPWGTFTRKTAAEVNGEFLSWLDRGSGPFFAFLNYMEGHHPFTVPPPWNTHFTASPPPVRLDWGNRYSEKELAHFRDAYDNAIAYVDAQLRTLSQELERRHLLDNTIIVVTADHGEQFGETSPAYVGHGNSLQYATLRVPLVIHGPGAGAARVEDVVSLRDLPATILDLLAVDGTAIPGHSLRTVWAGSSPGSSTSASAAISDLGLVRPFAEESKGADDRMRSIVAGQYHYIRNGDGTEQLFDVIQDPWERADLSKAAGDRLREMAALLRQAAETASPRKH
jgi:arylsulfatase A-like enzyme